MAFQNLKLFERDERDGWKLIMPLEGKRNLDSNLLNPEAARIFGDLRQNKTPIQIIDSISRKHKDVPYERIKNDVYAAILRLRELGVYEMTESEIEEICSNPANKLPGLHVMDETEIRTVSEKLRAACQRSNGLFLFVLGKPDIEAFEPYQIRAWHFGASCTFFVHNNNDGEMDGIISLLGMGELNPVVSVSMLAVFHNDAVQRCGVVVQILKQLETFIKSFTQASKIRFMICKKVESNTDSNDASCLCQQETFMESKELYGVFEECGFRHEATLNHEGGRGIHIEYYSKSLF
ncbi:MAG: hypothetical protein GWN00_05180 [Aliifodinibius sp.]|nr:hypothetical protein [Fodinibius sp.]NIV10594.1 hypothetical protein [Fodinibius sp.]NIY24222.1 hypothetical protein [Fodinibius sp.]